MSSRTISEVASTSTLTIAASGIVADSGQGGGNVALISAGGDARVMLEGGRVDGSAAVFAGTGTNSVNLSNSSSTFTRAATPPYGGFVPEIQQTQVSNSSLDQRAARGTATAAVAGTIGGDLEVGGTGAGAGTLAASAVVNGTVTGFVSVEAFAIDSRSSNSSTAMRTGPNTVVRRTTNSSTTAPSAITGNVLVAVIWRGGRRHPGRCGRGTATVNLVGRAGTVEPSGVSVRAFDAVDQRDSTQTAVGSNFFSLQPTGSRLTTALSIVGGTATLNVTPSAALLASGASSIEGDVFVRGLAGSALTTSAGSRIVQAAGQVLVGGNLTNSTSEATGVFSGTVQTGSSGSSTARSVGGPATIINAGAIGSSSNQVAATAASIGGATVRNTGTVNGAILADARGASRSTTTTTTNLNVLAQRRTVMNNVITAEGGMALVDNSGLTTGGITAIGATGTVTNSGVVRGAVTLGGSFTNFGTTVTTTFATGAAVSTTTVAPPAALFTQNYRLDQNGLLLGGVNVTATTTVDPSGVTLRTSNVNAQINLNNGSITLDNITAGANTAANVNLNGSGFLGVAANDTSSTLTPGQIVTGFLPTPSLTRFLTVDPALGVTVPLMSGSRISGIQTVTKVGDGSFVIVGAPVVAATGTTPLVNTLDVATLRVSRGELQLGLATTTPTTNTFGIRGNVDNAASLVIGRRITDGTQTAVREINLAVGGNLANAATGNLVVGVNPAFTRVNPAAPFAPFGQTPGIASVPSFVRVDGNLALAGAVDVVAPVGGIYEAGRAYDLFNVGGTFTNTSTVRSSLGSPFISFTLTPRSEGGRTIVSLNVARGNFDTVTTDRNSIAAARALQTALPGVFAGLRGGLAGSQDLASIVAAFDTRLPRTRVRRRSDTCRRANSMDRWPPSRPPFLLVRRSTVLQARDRQASDFGSAQPASSQPTRRTRPPARRASISIITADRSASTIPPDQARISALRADTARWTSVEPARLNAPKRRRTWRASMLCSNWAACV